MKMNAIVTHVKMVGAVLMVLINMCVCAPMNSLELAVKDVRIYST